jgi:hypothetical protein
MTSTINNFLDSGDSRETSDEIMAAIYVLAKNNPDVANQIWADPSDPEILSIWETVTKNGLIDSTEFFWGSAGAKWALSNALPTG